MTNTEEIISAWPSHILKGTINNKEVVDDLVNHIFTTYTLPMVDSRLGGANIFDDDRFATFKETIVKPAFNSWLEKCIGKSIDSFPGMEMTAWITGSHSGYAIKAHNHSCSQLTGVFYLLNDSPEDTGQLTVFDPRANANRAYNDDWSEYFKPIDIKAYSYTYVVLPSFLYHQVASFSGNMRMAIPVDLFVYHF